MDIGKSLQSLFWIGGIIAAIVALLGIGIKLGERTEKNKIDSYEEQLSFYKSTEGLNLPALITDMSKTTKELKQAISDSELLTKIQNRNAIYKYEIDSLKNYCDSITELISNKNKDIAELQKRTRVYAHKFNKLNVDSEKIVIDENESRYIIPNNLLLGVTHVWSSSVEFRLAGKKETIKVGESVERELVGNTVVLMLRKIISRDVTNSGAEFEYSIVNKNTAIK